MIKLDLATIAEILDATLIGEGETAVENVSTDTRQAVKNGLFFALKGDNFDAHHYLNQAVEQGCVAVVVEHQSDVDVPQLIVANTRLALGTLAQWLKQKLNPKIVAMTGSSGKTTVKEMTAKILQKMTASPDEVLFTYGNLNNDIGVPLTLLRLTEQHKFAVIELGANHIGEIAYTSALVSPDTVLVNNVAAAHLEGFGSLAGVAQAKGEIYQGLKPTGTAIINLAHYSPLWSPIIGNRLLHSFAFTGKDSDSYADYWAENVQQTADGSTFVLHTPQGETEISLPYLGEHNVSNALAATALAMSVGADLQAVKAGLSQAALVKGRLYPVKINEQLLLIDDSYNANVDSLKSAIAVLARYDAYRILVVGDMAELGTESLACHQQVADTVLASDLDLVVSFGKDSAVISGERAHHFTDKKQLTDFILPIIQQKLANGQQVVLLAKGSRRMKMEDIIISLCDSFNFSF